MFNLDQTSDASGSLQCVLYALSEVFDWKSSDPKTHLGATCCSSVAPPAVPPLLQKHEWFVIKQPTLFLCIFVNDPFHADQFICAHPGCGKAYPNKKGLKRHSNLHAGITFRCGVGDCQNEYGDSGTAARHRNKAHPGTPATLPSSGSKRPRSPQSAPVNAMVDDDDTFDLGVFNA